MAPNAATLIARQLVARQVQDCIRTEDGFIDENSCYVPFWNTRTGVIVKWSLFLGLIVVIGLYLLFGYLHAQKRLREGLPPLGYHRFLVPRATLAQVDPRYRYPEPAAIYPHAPESQYYDMYDMPPPVYDPNAPRPPKYEPPAGAAKVDSNQQPNAEQNGQPTGQYAEYAPPAGSPPGSDQPQDSFAPPPGPPPSDVQPQGTGNTNPFRN